MCIYLLGRPALSGILLFTSIRSLVIAIYKHTYALGGRFFSTRRGCYIIFLFTFSFTLFFSVLTMFHDTSEGTATGMGMGNEGADGGCHELASRDVHARRYATQHSCRLKAQGATCSKQKKKLHTKTNVLILRAKSPCHREVTPRPQCRLLHAVRTQQVPLTSKSHLHRLRYVVEPTHVPLLMHCTAVRLSSSRRLCSPATQCTVWGEHNTPSTQERKGFPR